jgi:hypothetical protein
MSRAKAISIGIGGLVIGLLIGAVVFGASWARAQDGTAEPDGTEQPGEPEGHRGPGGPGGGLWGGCLAGADPEYMEQIHETVKAAVADALGLKVEELDAAQADGKRLEEIAEEQGVELQTVLDARRAALEEALAQAVTDGVITQDQADWMLEHMDERRGPAELEGIDPAFFEGLRDVEHAALAEALDMTVEELEAAVAGGQHPQELIEAAGLDPATVGDALKAARDEYINGAVADGTITQEQADFLLAAPVGGRGRGGPGGRPGGHRGGPGGGPGGSQQP